MTVQNTSGDDLYKHHPDDLSFAHMFPLRWWIACKDMMPEPSEPVVVKGSNLGNNTDFSYDIAIWTGACWLVEHGTEIMSDSQEITHWMSLESKPSHVLDTDGDSTPENTGQATVS